MKKVLFLCTENACRSQLAEAITRHFWGDRIDAFSAGQNPQKVHPMTIKVLKELGIGQTELLYAKPLNQFIDDEFDLVVTLCDNTVDNCPFLNGGGELLHMPFKDPSKGKDGNVDLRERFLNIAKEMKMTLEKLFRKKGWL